MGLKAIAIYEKVLYNRTKSGMETRNSDNGRR
jgi:hypothetical protein